MTTFTERLSTALAVLCGQDPPSDLVDKWLRHEGEELQQWALQHTRLAWAQGIATIEAAEMLAAHPREGVGHQRRTVDEGRLVPPPRTRRNTLVYELDARGRDTGRCGIVANSNWHEGTVTIVLVDARGIHGRRAVLSMWRTCRNRERETYRRKRADILARRRSTTTVCL